MWPVALAVGATIAAFLVFALWQSRLLVTSTRRCRRCGHERHPVPPPPGRHRTYEVLACPHCSDVSCAVRGQLSRFAVCPSCSQFGLEVDARAVGLAEVGVVPPIAVEERCRICGRADDWSIPELDEPDNVIEFPRR